MFLQPLSRAEDPPPLFLMPILWYKLWARLRITSQKHYYFLDPLESSPRTTLPLCRSTCCGWGGLRDLMTPRAMLAGALSSWQGHPIQTGQRVGARLSVAHWSSRFGVWRGADNSTAEKVPSYETSHIKRMWGRRSSSRTVDPRRRHLRIHWNTLYNV
jgi:hypothetical protein